MTEVGPITKELLYENPSLTFSAIHQQHLGTTLRWKPWGPRVVRIYGDGTSGTLHYARSRKADHITPHHIYLLDQHLELELAIGESNSTKPVESILTIKTVRQDGITSSCRVLGHAAEIEKVIAAINQAMGRTDLQYVDHRQSLTVVQSTLSSVFGGNSAMRRAVSHAMNMHDKRDRKQRIMARRGAFKWLPVAGANDLTQGSW